MIDALAVDVGLRPQHAFPLEPCALGDADGSVVPWVGEQPDAFSIGADGK